MRQRKIHTPHRGITKLWIGLGLLLLCGLIACSDHPELEGEAQDIVAQSPIMPYSIRLQVRTNGKVTLTDVSAPQIAQGSAVTWTYRITNTGYRSLTDITIEDDKRGTICNIHSLRPLQRETCTNEGVAQAGSYQSTARVRAMSSGGGLEHQSRSFYQGISTSTAAPPENQPGATTPETSPANPGEAAPETPETPVSEEVVATDPSNPSSQDTNTPAPPDSTDSTDSGSSEQSEPSTPEVDAPETEVPEANVPDVSESTLELHSAVQAAITVNGVSAQGQPGPEFHEGQTLTITYDMTNVGNTLLTDVQLVDDGVDVSCPTTQMSLGQSMLCMRTLPAGEGDGQRASTMVVTATALDPKGDFLRGLRQTFGFYYRVRTATTPETQEPSPPATSEPQEPATSADQDSLPNEPEPASEPDLQPTLPQEELTPDPETPESEPEVPTSPTPAPTPDSQEPEPEPQEPAPVNPSPDPESNPQEPTPVDPAPTPEPNPQAPDPDMETPQPLPETEPTPEPAPNPEPQEPEPIPAPAPETPVPPASFELGGYVNEEKAVVFPGPTVDAGELVPLVYTIKNTSSVDLLDIELRKEGGAVLRACDVERLEPRVTIFCGQAIAASPDQQTIHFTVSATPEGSTTPISAKGIIYYTGEVTYNPEMTLTLTVNGKSASAAPGPILKEKGALVYKLAIYNSGNALLKEVELDSSLSDWQCPAETLVVGETLYCEYNGTADLGQHQLDVSVLAQAVDANGNALEEVREQVQGYYTGVQANIPAQPSDIRVAQGGNGIHISWRDNSSDESSFVIYRRLVKTGSSTRLIFVDADTTSYVDSTAEPYVTYIYSVAATGNDGESQRVESTPVMLEPDQTTPPNLHLQQPKDGAQVSVTRVTLLGTASDLDGVARLSYSLNGGALQDVTRSLKAEGDFTFGVLNLSQGSNTITIYAEDTQGNRQESTLNLNAVSTVGTTVKGDGGVWNERAPEIVKEWTPRIEGIIGKRFIPVPDPINIEFDDHDGVAYAGGNRMVISSAWTQSHPDDLGVVNHELVHLVQNTPLGAPIWLIEGIADYVRYFYFEPEKGMNYRPSENSNYTNGYLDAAAMLYYTERTRNPTLVKQLNTRLFYSDDYFKQLTGLTPEEAWQEFIAAMR